MIFDRLFAAARVARAPVQDGPSNRLFRLTLPVAGVQIDEHVALNYSAVFGAVRIIAESLAMLPWRVYRQSGASRQLAADHGVDGLIHRKPNDEMTAVEFWSTLVAHVLLWGNGYAEIERSRGGVVGALWPVTPDRVNPTRDASSRLVYEIDQGAGANLVLRPDSMFHARGLGFDGVVGYSVVRLAREAISLGLALEQYGASFFGNGAIPGGVIEQNTEHGAGLSPDAVKNLLATWNKRNQGSGKAHKVEYLDAGMTYKTIGVPPEDAQFLDSRTLQVREIARWFRIPPHKLGDLERTTHNNIESQNIEFVTDTLMPWAVRFEQAINARLLGESDLYTKINLAALLRGDSTMRGEYYKTMLEHGIYSIDEVRQLEDQNHLPESAGQLRLVPMNMMSVDLANRQGSTGQSADRGLKAVAMATAERVTKVEIKRLEAAARKPQPPAAIAEFYVEQRQALPAAFRPVGLLVCDALGLQGVEPYAFVSEVCCRWINDSASLVDQALAEDRLDTLLRRWETTRAAALADCLVQHLFDVLGSRRAELHRAAQEQLHARIAD